MTRKWGPVAAAVAVLATGALAPGAVAAPQADDDGAGPALRAPGMYYTQTSDPVRVHLPVTIDAGDGASVRGVTLTVDASEVRGVVRLYAKRVCEEGAGYVFTCRLTSSRQRHVLTDLVVLGADKAAEPGTHGTVRLTATGPDGQRAEAETVMTAGTPELWGKKVSIKDAPAGKPVEIRGGVLNRGPIAATGFGVEVTPDSRTQLARRYRNCRYTETSPTKAYCFFDKRVEPGRAYAFDAPFVADGGTALTKGSVYVNAFAPGQDAGPYFDEAEYTVQGAGPELGLTPTEPEGFARGSSHVSIVTRQHVDLQAVAGDLRGRPGDVVELRVGLRNDGPGQVAANYLSYTVVPPEGTTLLPPEKPSPDPEADELPTWVCEPWEPGAKRYSCGSRGLGPGESDTDVLRFRIDEEKGAPGRVTAVAGDDYADRDPDKGDNVAAITVNGHTERDVRTEGNGDGKKAGPGERRETADGRRSGGIGWELAVGAGVAAALALAAVPYVVRRRRRRN
ncbi:hypothetical protein [Streptomyces sp. Da 82-17]|uniref:hypothetical protein n=1 Tax=Streptomyces sp. Da 82-17 TaxID=3377116 RepID=UPI0038D3AE89